MGCSKQASMQFDVMHWCKHAEPQSGTDGLWWVLCCLFVVKKGSSVTWHSWECLCVTLNSDEWRLIRLGERQFLLCNKLLHKKMVAHPTVQIVRNLWRGASVWSRHKLFSCVGFCEVQRKGSVPPDFLFSVLVYYGTLVCVLLRKSLTECHLVTDNLVQRVSHCWYEHSVVGGSNSAVSGPKINGTVCWFWLGGFCD